SQVKIPPGGTRPPQTPPLGVRFTETMRGFVQLGAHAEVEYIRPEDALTAEKAGKKAGAKMEFTLDIAMDDVDRFLIDKEHAATAVGSVTIAGITPPGGAKVERGVFNLFAPTDNPAARRMIYLLPFTGADGRPYLLDGYKDVRDHDKAGWVFGKISDAWES